MTTASAPARLKVDIRGLHPGQIPIAAHRARFRVVCAGRRFGKSRIGAAVALETALKGGRVWWVAPTAKLARIGWRDLRRMSVKIPGTSVRLGDQLISYPGGGWIQVRTAGEPGGLRGEGLDGLVYDEAALGREDSWTEELRPALADRSGWALFLSTPKGRNNWFYRLWLRASNDRSGEWAAWQLATNANPHIPASEIEAAREELPAAVFDQEFGAMFNEAGASPFDAADVDGMADGWVGLSAPVAGRDYLTAWDIGRRGDPVVGVTVDYSTDPYQVVAFEREYRIPYAEQQSMIDRRALAYVGRTVVESNGPGDPVIENLAMRVEPFVTSARSKVQALQALQLLLERGALKCDLPDVTRELRGYQWDDKGLVQDCVMALAIAAIHLPKPGSGLAPTYEDLGLDHLNTTIVTLDMEF